MILSVLNRAVQAACLIAFVTISSGCDWIPNGPGTPLIFQGEVVTREGDARLSIENGALYIRNLGGTNEGGFRVPGDLLRVDVDTDSVETSGTDHRFGVSVQDGNDDAIASLFIEGYPEEPSVGGGSVKSRLVVAFAPGDQVQTARIRYRLQGTVVYEIPSLPVGGGQAEGLDRLAADESGIVIDGVAGSVHVIRGSDGRYTVVSDAEGGAARPGDEAEGGCPGYTVLPPGARQLVCADWVEVTPLDGATRSAQGTAVTARGVGEVVVRRLEVTRAAGRSD